MSTAKRIPFQHGYCPRCGRNRWHWLANPCRHREFGRPGGRASTQTRTGTGDRAGQTQSGPGMSTWVSWAIIGLTAAYVVARMPW